MGAARKESSQVACVTRVKCPLRKISAVYSSKALLESPTNGQYFITIVWSTLSLSLGYSTGLAWIESSNTPALDISLLLN